MCLDFMFYYPRVPHVRRCLSIAFEPTYKTIHKYLNDVNLTSPYRNPLVDKEIDWTDRMVSDFKKYEDDVKEVFPVCSLYNLTTVADTKNPNLTVPIPEITEPLPPKKSNCPETTPAPVPAGNAANEGQSPVVFPLFLGLMWAVILYFESVM